MNATRVGDGREGRANNDASTLLNPKRGVAATPPPPACVPVKREKENEKRGARVRTEQNSGQHIAEWPAHAQPDLRMQTRLIACLVSRLQLAQCERPLLKVFGTHEECGGAKAASRQNAWVSLRASLSHARTARAP